MPRKLKRTEEWERRADERFEAHADQAVPTWKTTKVSKVTDVDATVEEEPEKPEKPKAQQAQRHKKCEAVDDIPLQKPAVGSLELLNAAGHGLSRDTEAPKCGGYKDGLGDIVEMDVREGPSRNEVASLAFGHDSVRGAYEELGAAGFYELKGASYVNPHEDVLSEALQMALDEWHRSREHRLFPLRRSLDLACGSGEATLALEAWLQKHALEAEVEAADPYTFEAFERRLGRSCHRWSFEDIAEGIMEQEPIYDLVLCSFALHLLDRSWIACTLSSLARRARFLVVATPHKRPVIEKRFGWEQLEELLHKRVRIRLYRSLSVDED